MPKVWSEVRFRGEKAEVEVRTLVNSGASLTVITEEIARAIKPKRMGPTRVILATGEEVEAEVYIIKIEVYNPKTGERRKCETEALLLSGRKYPLLGISAMDKLRVSPDVPRGELRFE